MGDAQLVEAIAPLLQLRGAGEGEAHVVEAGARSSNGPRTRAHVRVEPEELAAVEQEHGVVEGAGLLVLVEHGLGAEQAGVPLVLRSRSETVIATCCRPGKAM